jgi:hypothetical protein
MEAIWRFHHETWDEPWSSDDFPVGDDKKLDHLISEPWWGDRMNEVVQFLHDEFPHQLPWGYTIHRTVYTPESN